MLCHSFILMIGFGRETSRGLCACGFIMSENVPAPSDRVPVFAHILTEACVGVPPSHMPLSLNTVMEQNAKIPFFFLFFLYSFGFKKQTKQARHQTKRTASYCFG